MGLRWFHIIAWQHSKNEIDSPSAIVSTHDDADGLGTIFVYDVKNEFSCKRKKSVEKIEQENVI